MSDDTDVDPQVESKAREMGWTPKEKFRGDPEKWVDAQTFVERGEHVLPILRADRDRLRGELLTRDQKIGTLEQQLEATSAIVQSLEKSFSESLQRQLAEQRNALKAQLREAVEDKDVDAELAIRDQLDDLKTAETEARNKAEANKDKLNPKPKEKDTNADGAVTPEFKEWKSENTWFGGDSPEDKKRTKAIMRIAEDLRDDGDTTVGRPFMDKCLELLEEQERGGNGRGVNKVDSGNSRGGGRSSESSSYAALPAEAKQACDADEAQFVGEGKLFKDQKAWRAYFVKLYNGN